MDAYYDAARPGVVGTTPGRAGREDTADALPERAVYLVARCRCPGRAASLMPSGIAAAYLSRFQDPWSELTAEGRAWFGAWLNSLLIEAVVPGIDLAG